jgi:hypothetical protein
LADGDLLFVLLQDISNFEEPEDQDDGIDTGDIVLDQKDFAGW